MKHLNFLAVFMAALVAMSAAAVQPERPTAQSMTYNEEEGYVDFQVKMPTTTVYDEYYIQYDLDHIDSFIIERRFQGGSYDSFTIVASIENPQVGETLTARDPSVEPQKAYEYKFSVIVDDEKGQSDYMQVFTAPVPGAITDFSATINNTPSVTLTLTAPKTDASGKELKSLTAVVIERSTGMFDTETIKTFTPVTPGDYLTYTDPNVEQGKTYYYRAYALNGDNCRGERTQELQVKVGQDVPGKPSNLVATVTGENQVTLTWEAPTAGFSGGIFDPEEVEYDIYRKFWDSDETELIKNGVKETTYIDDTNLDEESVVQYILLAANAAGECPVTISSNEVLVGNPTSYPFTESFSDKALEHKGWTKATTYYDEYYMPQTWVLHENKTMFYYPTDENLSIEPFDNDGGMAVAYFYIYEEAGTTHSLISPRIDMTQAENPQLTLYYFETCREATENQMRISIKANDQTEWTQVYESVILDQVEPNWHEVSVNLQQYAGKDWINIKIDAVRGGDNIVDFYIDAIKLIEKSQSGLDTIDADDTATIRGGKGVINVNNAQNLAVTVYNTSGSIVATGNSDTSISVVPGIYIVKAGQTVAKVSVD